MDNMNQASGQTAGSKRKIRVSFNSPVVLGFTLVCLAALLLARVTGGRTNALVFSTYHSSLTNPMTYVRFIGHVFGHANWDHFLGNITLLLVIGPLLEEKYGSSNILFIILATAITTGVANYIFFPNVRLLGASGVVFAFILLSSFTSIKEGMIPLTFILVAIIYIGQEIYAGLCIPSNISNFTHIVGGLVGSGLGYVMHKNKMNRI